MAQELGRIKSIFNENVNMCSWKTKSKSHLPAERALTTTVQLVNMRSEKNEMRVSYLQGNSTEMGVMVVICCTLHAGQIVTHISPLDVG